MHRMPAGDEIELALRIDLDADPITGWLTTVEGERCPFRGWIGLSAALERIRAGGGHEPEGAADA